MELLSKILLRPKLLFDLLSTKESSYILLLPYLFIYCFFASESLLTSECMGCLLVSAGLRLLINLAIDELPAVLFFRFYNELSTSPEKD